MKTISFICLLAYTLVGVSGQAMGPYDVVIRSFESCPENMRGTDQIRVRAKLQRISRTKVVGHVNVTFEVPFSDALQGKVVGAKQTSQGWKDNFITFDSPKVCQIMKTAVPKIIPDIMKSIGLNRRDCPIPVGNYSFMWPLDTDIKSIPVFVYNKYRFRIFLLLNQIVVSCMQASVDVIPKKQG